VLLAATQQGRQPLRRQFRLRVDHEPPRSALQRLQRAQEQFASAQVQYPETATAQAEAALAAVLLFAALPPPREHPQEIRAVRCTDL